METLIAHRARSAMLIVSTSALVLTACTAETTSDPSGDMSPPVTAEKPASSAPTPTTTAVDKAKQDALSAYRGMWDAFVVAGRTSDWQSPELGEHATGAALQNLTRGLYTDHQNGVVTKGEPVLDPRVSSVEPAKKPKKVVISDCGDSTNYLKYDANSGQPVDDEPGGRQQINAIVKLQTDGSWKVSDYGVHEVGSC